MGEWQDIETLPSELSDMADLWIVSSASGAGQRVVDCFRDHRDRWAIERYAGMLTEMHPGYIPTHWMPRPAPPKEPQ